MKDNLKFMRTKLITVKNLFIAIFSTLCFSAQATDYYLSANGNDGNNGISSSTPWRTINKLNSVLNSLRPGDNIFFNRGDVFYGSISISRSGSSGSPITFSAYGSGATPIITGFTTVNSWTNLGGNIWESTSSVSGLSYTNVVVINGNNTAMGRYPNSGYNTISSFSNNSITDGSLSGNSNWTGSNLVIKKNKWTIDNCTITSQSGGTINYTGGNSSSPIIGFGYFIQNNPQTLDQQGEWYYNPSSQNLEIYSLVEPSNVQVGSIQTLISTNGMDYITLDHLSFQGANQTAILGSYSANITIQNCNITFSGQDAINMFGCENLTVQNCLINQTNNCAIYAGASSGNGNNALIKNNIIKNTGTLPGMGNHNGWGYTAICSEGPGANIVNNEIDSTGYNGINFNNNSAIINNNFINYFCLVADDGGGIYTDVGKDPNTYSGRQVTNNIIINGIGSGDGTDQPTLLQAEGIFVDDATMNILISGNSIANCSNRGINIHNSHDIQIWNNTVFNNKSQLELNKDNISNVNIRNIDIKNNIFVAATPQQYIEEYRTPNNDISSFFVADNNYLTRPIQESNSFSTGIGNGGPIVWTSYDLAGFQNLYNQDIHSKKAPIGITSTNSLKFVYNGTSSPVTSQLDASYIDVKNNSYNGSITLQPYTSAVLIYTGPATNVSTLQLNLSSKTDVSCSGGNDGIIQVAATGGSAPYTYSINYGPFNSQNLFSNLAPGSYTIYTRDNNGSQTSIQVIIGGGAGACGSFQLNVLKKADASCSGGADGSVQVAVSGGSAPYTYNINYGLFTTNNSFSSLSAGSYVIYAKDNNGLQTSIPVTIGGGPNACGTLNLSLVNESDVNCLGGTDANITVNASGGTPPYTYNINYGLFSSNNNFNNLTAGLYIIYVQDKNGLQASSLQVKVNDGLTVCPFQLNLANTSNVSCNGGSDGSVNVLASGGTPPYTYNINYGIFSASNNFNNLGAGLYVIYAHDKNGLEAPPLIETITNGIGACSLASTSATSLSDNISISNTLPTSNHLTISAAPNPTRDLFTLLIRSGSTEPVNFQVLDVNSKIVYQSIGKLNAPNTFGGNFLSGMYFIRVQQGTNVQTIKVMKIK
jgi:hypothetical protein